MKKILLPLIGCLMFILNATTQTPYISLSNNVNLEFYKIEYGMGLEDKKVVNKREEIKLKQTNFTHKNKNNKIESEGYVTYNPKGRLTEIKNKKSNKYLVYENDSLLINYIEVNKTPQNFNYSYQKGHFTGYQKYKNGKLISELIITYNDKGKVTSRLTKKGKNLKKTSEQKTFYYADGKIQKSQTFINGKLKREYIYECKPEGEIVDVKKVDNASVCTWKEERNDGSYINYVRSIEEKDTYLWKGTFDKDSNLIASERLLNDTIKVHSFEKKGNTEITNHYNKKGKLTYTFTLIFNDSHFLIERQNRYGRKMELHKSINEYDEKGMLTKTINSHEDKILSTVEYNHIYR